MSPDKWKMQQKMALEVQLSDSNSAVAIRDAVLLGLMLLFLKRKTK